MTDEKISLILASASPRRRQILRDAGFRFVVLTPADDVEERVELPPGISPEEEAVRKAEAKAKAVARRECSSVVGQAAALIVAADTLAALGNERLGKPLNREDALRILSRLSGTRHRVITGLCCQMVGDDHRSFTAADTTWVTMRKATEAELTAYVASGEGDGKAGAYAVQETGDRFIECLDGSFSNVVGFPLEMFLRTLPELWQRWKLPGSWRQLLREDAKPS